MPGLGIEASMQGYSGPIQEPGDRITQSLAEILGLDPGAEAAYLAELETICAAEAEAFRSTLHLRIGSITSLTSGIKG